jgi:hypothetical protein
MPAFLRLVDPFLEIEARQDEVLARLDELNDRLEKLLDECQGSLKPTLTNPSEAAAA